VRKIGKRDFASAGNREREKEREFTSVLIQNSQRKELHYSSVGSKQIGEAANTTEHNVFAVVVLQ
jgi:hypothetical protein